MFLLKENYFREQINHKEFTQAVHQATPQTATFVVTVIVNETPIDQNYWVLAGIVPDGDR